MARQIKQHQTKPRASLNGKPLEHKLPLEEMSHIVGQAAAIRFFDENSKDDFMAINEILRAKQVRNWMDDAGRISWPDYQEWAGMHTIRSFLFSVHDSRLDNPVDIKKIRGFVNIYSERGEKFRVKRMAKLGIIKDIKDKHFLEISMALRPMIDGKVTGSGLMSSALRQSCLQVRSWLNYPKESDLVIFGFLDSSNKASIRALEAAGFIKKGKAKYDSTTDDESLVYILSWRKLQKKVKDKLEKTLRNKMKIVMEPQKTESHCGPAVVKALFGFNKIEISQDDVVNAAKIKTTIMKKGMRPDQIALAVKRLDPDMQLLYKQNTSGKDLDKLIHVYRLPVAVNWQGLFFDSVKEEKIKRGNDDRGHYSVAIDIDTKKGEIVIDDPYHEYFNNPRVFSFSWFKKRWYDNDEIIHQVTKEKSILKTNKLIFVIVPKNHKLPASLGLKRINDLSELEKANLS